MKKHTTPGSVYDVDEQWKPVQVAAYMELPYQTARNQMLSGIYGPSQYDPQTRALTVSKMRVVAAKEKRDRRRRKRRR